MMSEMLYLFDSDSASKRVATLDDIQVYLAEHGLVAVPLEPTEVMIEAGISDNQEACGYDIGGSTLASIYKAMIAAQGEE
jgi:hypothetical protein